MEEKNKGKYSFHKILLLIIITAFLTFICTNVYIFKKYNIENIGSTNLVTGSKLQNQINMVKKVLKEKYISDIDFDKAEDYAVKGYVASLGDPYTSYITKEEMKEFTVNIEGNYVGIGIYMMANPEENAIQVILPIKGSPAEEVGILPGDLIISVNGEKCTADNINEMTDKIKGEEGTKVNIEIKRNNEIKQFEVSRRKVETNPVESKKIENDIGYIKITSFNVDTSKEVEKKLQELQNQGIKSLIIDLRDNGGGIVDQALNIADLFVEKNKTLLITKDKNKEEEIFKAKKKQVSTLPIIVLVNENTASASEILCGALRDNGRAKLVGIKTYGKGVIQEVKGFPDGSGIKVTIQEYFTPNKNKINLLGLEPDIKIELPKGVNSLIIKENEDLQLKRAIEELSKKGE